MKKLIFIGIAITVLLSVMIFWDYQSAEAPGIKITNFEGCAAQGYSILESYPRQCRMPGGEVFIEDVGNALEKQDIIQLTTPYPNEIVQSPLEIKGKARGYWFFEADFPVRLIDANGQELGTSIAQTFSEWMTEDFVPFEATLEFKSPTTKTGTLVLQKDNPSGLPENVDELRIPVGFSD